MTMSITLVSINNINKALTEFAVNKSFENFNFDNTFVMSDEPLTGVRYYHNHHNIDDVIQFAGADGKPIPWNYDAYNIFLLKNIADYIQTDHIINIHYDGFCVNNQYWSDEFLEYDYIGSPTFKDWTPLANSLKSHDLYDRAPNTWYNGGGGFTLRSKKLLKALQDPRIDTTLSDKNFERCEDATISIKFRRLLEEEYKIKFAPMDVSLKWCTELLTGLPYSFGFHGWTNIPLFLTKDECIWYIENLNRRDMFQGSPMVQRYIAMCVIQYYYRAIDHINSVISDQAKIEQKHKNYNR
jgi:hypothetical protein